MVSLSRKWQVRRLRLGASLKGGSIVDQHVKQRLLRLPNRSFGSGSVCVEPAKGQPRGGPSVSIPVLSGLCRVADIVLMAAASAVTGLLLRRVSDVPPWGEFVVVCCIAIAVARAAAERLRVYSLPALLDPLGHVVPLALSLASAAVASAGAILLLHHGLADLPYLITQPVAWALSSGATLLAFRSVVAWRLNAHAQAGRLGMRIALVGATETSLRFFQDAARDPGLTVVGIFDDRATDSVCSIAEDALRGTLDDLVALARAEPVDAILISLPLSATGRIDALRQRLVGVATDILIAADFGPILTPTARLTRIGDSSVLSISERPLKDWTAFKKGLFDRVSSALFLLLGAPLMALIALIVKLDSPGPALFRQDREGLNGVPFTMLKFRTMQHRSSADESVQATADDRRVTRSGYWLRRFSLDELPQLWNVLRGDMSLVGPRPHLATTRAGNRLFSDVVPDYQARHRMKPGLTGWAQVQGLRGETRTEKDIADRVAQDLYYIDNWSLGLDLRIIVRTILREIVSRSGRAY